MIREIAEALATRRVMCSQLRPRARGTGIHMERCPGVAITATPAALGSPHPRPLCASCAQGFAYVLENDTVYARLVAAAGLDPLEIARELRSGAGRALS